MDNMVDGREILIKLLLASGHHDEVEAEMRSFMAALNAENWCKKAVFWHQAKLWNGPQWELPTDMRSMSGENVDAAKLPDELIEQQPPQGEIVNVGQRFFYRVNNELLFEIEFLLEISPDGQLREVVKTGVAKFANHLNRRLARKIESERRKEGANPLEQLAVDPDLQQRVMATLSHELRNPLNLIIGYSNILNDTPLNSVQRESVSIIRDSGIGLFQTIKKVFQFLHVMMGKLVDEEMEFRIKDVATLLGNQILPLMAAKGLQWKVNIPKEADLWLKGDMSKLNDILIYLLENAIKFSSKGVIELTISYDGIDEDEKGYRFGFMIRDQGKGIGALNQLHVFRFFSQEDDSITRNYGGLGLGLSLAKVFVRRLGGNLVLKSAVGQGTIFLFQITFAPAIDAERLEVSNHLPELEITAEIPILIADDDAYQRSMAAHILQHWKLHFAENGHQAIEHLRNNPETRIVLMDIRMPEMDGIQATRIIRQKLGFTNPIIAVSGEALETTIEECLDAGMNAFVSKPFEREQLLRTMLLHCAPIRKVRPDVIKLRPVDKLSGLKGLVVEDNKMIQMLTMRYLRDLECNAALAMDIETALEKIANNEYDFILLDLHLPDGTGYEVARTVRRNDSQTCIIAYSGEDSDETRSMCHAAGINGIILKSYHTAQELAIKINRFIQEHRPDHAYLQHETESKDPGKDYDLAQVKEIVGNSSADLVLLLEVFVEHSGNTLNQLIEANRNNDLKTLSRHAHSLKSSARQFGMERAADLLFVLELRTGNLDLDQRNSMCEELKTIFSRALPDMANEIQKMKS